MGDLGRYDGSSLIDRTAGEAAARCDSEAANILTLNLMHEMVTETRERRRRPRFLLEDPVSLLPRRVSAYREEFQFDVPRGDPGDPTSPSHPGPKAKQAAEKVEEFLSKNKRASGTAAARERHCRKRCGSR